MNTFKINGSTMRTHSLTFATNTLITFGTCLFQWSAIYGDINLIVSWFGHMLDISIIHFDIYCIFVPPHDDLEIIFKCPDSLYKVFLISFLEGQVISMHMCGLSLSVKSTMENINRISACTLHWGTIIMNGITPNMTYTDLQNCKCFCLKYIMQHTKISFFLDHLLYGACTIWHCQMLHQSLCNMTVSYCQPFGWPPLNSKEWRTPR